MCASCPVLLQSWLCLRAARCFWTLKMFPTRRRRSWWQRWQRTEAASASWSASRSDDDALTPHTFSNDRSGNFIYLFYFFASIAKEISPLESPSCIFPTSSKWWNVSPNSQDQGVNPFEKGACLSKVRRWLDEPCGCHVRSWPIRIFTATL